MQIFVRTDDGRASGIRTLEVSGQSTIHEVKQRLGYKRGTPAQDCWLTDGTRQLSDERSLDTYGIRDGMVLQLLGRGRGGASGISVTVRPRIQKDKWSLYWKESMETKTETLGDVTMSLPPSTTVAEVHKALQEKFGWQTADTAERLEGFKDPWDVSILRGRTVEPSATLESLSIGADEPLITVRRVLVPEGWKIIEEGQDEDDLSSDEEDW